VPSKVAANRAELDAHLERVRGAFAAGPHTAFELLAPIVGGPENLTPATGAWGLQLALAYIDHLVAAGELEEVEDSDPRLWQTVKSTSKEETQ
jgi:hypothetical protein